MISEYVIVRSTTQCGSTQALSPGQAVNDVTRYVGEDAVVPCKVNVHVCVCVCDDAVSVHTRVGVGVCAG